MTWFLYPPQAIITGTEMAVDIVKQEEKKSKRKFWLYALAGGVVVYIILKVMR